MKPYSRESKNGMKRAVGDIREMPKSWADAIAKAQRSAARQQGREQSKGQNCTKTTSINKE